MNMLGGGLGGTPSIQEKPEHTTSDRIADLWEAISEIRKSSTDLARLTGLRVSKLERREDANWIRQNEHHDRLQQIEDGDRKTQPDGQPTCGNIGEPTAEPNYPYQVPDNGGGSTWESTANAPESSCVSIAEVEAAMRAYYNTDDRVWNLTQNALMHSALEQFLANR